MVGRLKSCILDPDFLVAAAKVDCKPSVQPCNAKSSTLKIFFEFFSLNFLGFHAVLKAKKIIKKVFVDEGHRQTLLDVYYVIFLSPM